MVSIRFGLSLNREVGITTGTALGCFFASSSDVCAETPSILESQLALLLVDFLLQAAMFVRRHHRYWNHDWHCSWLFFCLKQRCLCGDTINIVSIAEHRAHSSVVWYTLGALTLYIHVGLAKIVYIYTLFDRIFDYFPAKNTRGGQRRKCLKMCMFAFRRQPLTATHPIDTILAPKCSWH